MKALFSWMVFVSSLLCISVTSLPVLAGTTERVSVGSAGQEANGASSVAAVSADGRFVAFGSSAVNLAPGGSTRWSDVYVRDRASGSVDRVSVGFANDDLVRWAHGPVITPDGRYVAFLAFSSHITPGGFGGTVDVYLRDRSLGLTERISARDDGDWADGGSDWPAISADGRFVVFSSTATNLVHGALDGRANVYVRDRAVGGTNLVWPGGDHPAISADGRVIAFSYPVSGLQDDGSTFQQVFALDQSTGVSEPVSVSQEGEFADVSSDVASPSAVSEDGRFIVLVSAASNLTLEGSNGRRQVYVRDREQYTNELISVNSAGEPADGDCSGGAISADGALVTFSSTASNLVKPDANGAADVFVRNRLANTTERVSISTRGAEGDQASGLPLGDAASDCSISADGQYVVFSSLARNLVTGDLNESADVFIRDRLAFWDVPSDFWALPYIQWCADVGVVTGFADGSYQPETAITRDQMAVYVARAFAEGDGWVPTGPALVSFSDLSSGYWAFKYIAYAYANGIISGYPDGTYRPSLPVTRDQMAVFIANTLSLSESEQGMAGYTPPAQPSFADVPPTFWAYAHVEYLKGKGVVSGYPDGLYHPERVCTRDQMAVYVGKAFGLPT